MSHSIVKSKYYEFIEGFWENPQLTNKNISWRCSVIVTISFLDLDYGRIQEVNLQTHINQPITMHNPPAKNIIRKK